LSTKFIKNTKKKTFIKLDFYTFKGLKKIIVAHDKIKKPYFLFKTRKIKDRIRVKLENYNKLSDKDSIHAYYATANPAKVINYKFYINLLIQDN
jgi:hypothetical protein